MVGLILPPPPLRPDHGAVERAALFLDFDGTLVEIAPTPTAVLVPQALPALLYRVAQGLGGALGIVSGRPLADLDRFLPVPLAKAGEHGAAVRPCPEAAPELPDLPTPPPEWRHRAEALVEAFPGALLEPKSHGFVLHYRLAAEAGPACEALLRHLASERPEDFTLLEARMAWELRPRGPSKGSAVRRLMAMPAFAGRTPVFIGDDVTDEAGMEVARAFGGHGWFVQDAFGTPAALRAWLAEAAGE